jgi:hypothetical protein
LRTPTLLTATATLALLTGCANTVVMPPAKIYSPAERLMPGPGPSMGATGEAKYCSGLPLAAHNESAKRQALANIARACGGEDQYAVLQEVQTDLRFRGAFGSVETACPLTTGRAILFKCAADKTPLKN